MTWLRDLIVIPLVVGAVLAIFTFLLPRFLSKDRELSYELEGPINYLNDPAIGHIELSVNGAKTAKLIAYRVRLWNSGDSPLKGIPVRIVFDTADSGFTIFSLSHRTTPAHEFGSIKEETDSPFSRRLVYDLLNPSDQDLITVIANSDPPVGFFAKAEGVALKHAVRTQNEAGWSKWAAWVGVALGLLGSLGGVVLKMFSSGEIKWRRG